MTRLSRRGQVEPFHVMETAAAAARRQDTHGDAILLCVGQPATPAPLVVREAARAAIKQKVLGYTVTAGIPELRATIAADYADRYHVGVDPADVVITTGSSAGFQLVLLAAFDAGDTVAMTRPGYPAYRNTLLSLGARVIDLEAGPQTRYQPTVAMLEALPEPPAGLVIASSVHCRLGRGVQRLPDRRAGRTIALVPAAASARWNRWARSASSSCSARARASSTCGDAPANAPRSSLA